MKEGGIGCPSPGAHVAEHLCRPHLLLEMSLHLSPPSFPFLNLFSELRTPKPWVRPRPGCSISPDLPCRPRVAKMDQEKVTILPPHPRGPSDFRRTTQGHTARKWQGEDQIINDPNNPLWRKGRVRLRRMDPHRICSRTWPARPRGSPGVKPCTC